jgi:hypothetical protein
MKQMRLLIILLLACGAESVWGQAKVPREVQFAVLGGAALSNYEFDPSITQSMAQGYTAGVAVRYIEEKFFGLQAELLMTRRGMKDRYDSYPQYSFQRDLTYLELPVMAHVYFNAGRRNVISFDAGPKLGYFLFDKTSGNLDSDFQTIAAGSNHGYAHHDMGIKYKFDYGIQAGLGYEFKFSQQLSLQLQGRYYFGLGNIFPDTKADTFETSRNNTVQIVMALWFHHRIRIPKMKRPEFYE